MHGSKFSVEFFAAFLVMLLTSAQSLAQQDDRALRGRFLRGVAAVAGKLDAPSFSFRARVLQTKQYTTVSAEWMAKYGERNPNPMQLRTIGKFECALRGPLALQKKLNTKQTIESLQVRNSSYAFAIKHLPHSGQTTLQFVDQFGRGSRTDAQIVEIESQIRGNSLAAYYLWDMKLSDLIETDAFQIDRVFAADSKSRSLVRVEFGDLVKTVEDGSTMLYSDGFLIVDPENEWAIQEYGATLEAPHVKNSQTVHHVVLEYGDSVNGMPIAKRVERNYTFPSEPGTTSEIVTTTEILPGDVLEDEFFLSYYGLPEPNFEPRAWGMWVWYLVAAVIFISTGLLMRKRRQTLV